MLTPKQQLFVSEYLVDLNATQAAVRAGYSAKTARQIGEENLTKPVIAQAVADALAKRAARVQVTADEVLRELKRIAFMDPRRVLSWGPDGVVVRDSSELSTDDAACVAEASQTVTKDGGTIKVKLASKLDALDKIARHLGMYNDKLEVTAATRLVIEEEVVDAHDNADGSAEPQAE